VASSEVRLLGTTSLSICHFSQNCKCDFD